MLLALLQGCDSLRFCVVCADHLKTSFSIGIAASMMAWGVLEFPQASPACVCPVVVELRRRKTWSLFMGNPRLC